MNPGIKIRVKGEGGAGSPGRHVEVEALHLTVELAHGGNDGIWSTSHEECI